MVGRSPYGHGVGGWLVGHPMGMEWVDGWDLFFSLFFQTDFMWAA